MDRHAPSISSDIPERLITPSQAAKLLGVHISTVRRWITRFQAKRFTGLQDRPRSGRPLTIKPSTRALVVALACERPADRAVPLRVQDLEPDVRRGGVADAVEDRIGVVLLRLVVEDEDDLSSRVEPRVIVVVELRGGDAEPGEHHRGGRFRVAREEADEVLEKLVALLLAGAAQRELRLLHVGQVLDDRDRLEVRASRQRRQSGLVEFRGNELHRNLGAALDSQGHIEEAIEACRRAIRSKPDSAAFENNLGVALGHRGQLAAAVNAYRRALQFKPDLYEAHNNLGNALADDGKPAEALPHYDFVLAREPWNVSALSNSGIALSMLGRYPEAIARLQKAVRLAPDNLNAQRNLAKARATMEQAGP